MKRLFLRIYSIYASLLFCITFLILFPFFFVIAQKESWHQAAYHLNKLWAKVFFALCFIRVDIEVRGQIDRGQVCVFCPNHASFMDIPMVGFAPSPFVFMGKSSIEKVPLFGYMYKKIHITVDRKSVKSRHNTYVKAQSAIDRGMSLMIFPEGGIFSTSPPDMVSFKNGAFKLAIEKQIPLIPVTIPFNWIILPDNGRFLMKPRRGKVIFHEPIDTVGLELTALESLKQKVFDIIDEELKIQLNNEHR